jgi:hypothetical protein
MRSRSSRNSREKTMLKHFLRRPGNRRVGLQNRRVRLSAISTGTLIRNRVYTVDVVYRRRSKPSTKTRFRCMFFIFPNRRRSKNTVDGQMQHTPPIGKMVIRRCLVLNI